MAIQAAATTDYFGLTSGFPNSGNGGGTSGAVTIMIWFDFTVVPSGFTNYMVTLGNGTDDSWSVENDGGTPNNKTGIYSDGGSDVWGTANLTINTWNSIAITISAPG